MFAEALNQTLNEYKISAKELAQRSGIKESTISDFRRGKIEPKIDTVEALIECLPSTAKNFMLFKAFLTKLTDEDISLLLHAIATEIRSSSDNQKHFDLVLK